MNWGSKHQKQITVGGTTKRFYTCSFIELTNTLGDVIKMYLVHRTVQATPLLLYTIDLMLSEKLFRRRYAVTIKDLL